MDRALCLLSCAALALPAGLAAGGNFTITAVVLEGDAVPGVGAVTLINNIAVNNHGDWLVEADTNNANTDADEVLLRSGVLDWREDDLVVAPLNARLGSFDSITLDDRGHSGYNFFLTGTQGTTDDSGVYAYLQPGESAFDGTVLVVQESQEAPGLTAGTPFIGFFDVKIGGAGNYVWVVASVDDPNIATTVDRALYILSSDPDNGGISTFNLIAREEEVLPGQIESVADFGTGPHASAINDNGHALFFADLNGSTVTDGVIYMYDGVDRLIMAQEGAPSPIVGRDWLTLSSPELDLSNTGHHVYSGVLTGDTLTDNIIIRDGAKFRQEGDPAPGLSAGVFTLTTFGTGPLEVSDEGDVLWYGDWNDPNLDIDTGLFLNDTLLVQEGVTVLEGSVVDSLRGIEDGYHMSNNGRFIIFEALLLDGREGAFLIEIPQCPWDCANNDGVVDTVDFLALLAEWGQVGSPCDFDATGVDTVDFLALLAAWGDCP